MKRIALLTVLLLVVGLTAGFAAELKPTLTLSGSATVTFGFDLDSSAVGFKNEADADMTLTFVAEDSTDTHAGAEGVTAYGSITFNDVEIILGGDDKAANPWAMSDWLTDGDVEAKIVVGNLGFGVYGAPSLEFENLDKIENDDVDDDVVDKDESDPTFGGAFGTNYGTWLSYAFAPVTVKVEVVSNGDWAGADAGDTTYETYIADGTEEVETTGDYIDGATGVAVTAGTTLTANKLYIKPVAGADAINANDESNFAFGGSVVLDLKPLTVTLGVSEDYVNSVTGFNAKLALAMAPIDAWVGFEGQSAAELTYAAGGGLTFTLAEGVTLATSFLYGDAFNGADVKIVFTEPEAGLVPGLDDTLTVYLLDIADETLAMEYEVINTLGYKVAMGEEKSARPYATVTYGATNATPSVGVFKAEVGVELNLIPLTKFTVKYASGNLSADPAVMGVVSLGATVTY